MTAEENRSVNSILPREREPCAEVVAVATMLALSQTTFQNGDPSLQIAFAFVRAFPISQEAENHAAGLAEESCVCLDLDLTVFFRRLSRTDADDQATIGE